MLIIKSSQYKIYKNVGTSSLAALKRRDISVYLIRASTAEESGRELKRLTKNTLLRM